MLRREVLKNLALVGTTSLLTTVPFLGRANSGAVNHNAVNYKALFKKALRHNPELIGFANIESNFSETKLKLEGKLPSELKGQFYRNGPGKHERGDIRYQHLFEGDGMLQHFHLDGNNVYHRGKFIETPKFKKEESAKQFLYSGPDTKIANSLPVSSSNDVNTANTNVISVGNDLWALWEAGAPSKINPHNLQFEDQVNLGTGSKYGNSLKGLPFSAHPKIDPNGDIWNFGLNGSGHVVLYHLSAKGQTKNVKLINAQYKGTMLHDFLITDRSILLILPSLISERSHNSGYFESIDFAPQMPMRVLVVNKSDLTLKREFELPPGFAFHFGNAWEENDGTIHFDASLYPNINILHKMSRLMQGDVKQEEVNGNTTLFTLHNNGKTSQHSFNDISEFPRVSNHKVGLKNHKLYHLSSAHDSLWSDAVVSLDVDSGKEDKFSYGSEFLVEEHVPVNPRAKEGHGYLIGTALHIPTQRTCLNVFDLANLKAGPRCRAWLPYHLPLGFHGNFVTS